MKETSLHIFRVICSAREYFFSFFLIQDWELFYVLSNGLSHFPDNLLFIDIYPPMIPSSNIMNLQETWMRLNGTATLR